MLLASKVLLFKQFSDGFINPFHGVSNNKIVDKQWNMILCNIVVGSEKSQNISFTVKLRH